MKKLFAFLILCLGSLGILEAQNIWEPLTIPGSLKGVNSQGDLFCIKYSNPMKLLRSQDKGETWDTVFTGGIGNCIIGKEDRIFLLCDRIINYSDDNGETWLQTSPIDEGTGYNYFSSMRMRSPSNNILVGWQSPFIIWTSDGGATWDSTRFALEDHQEIKDLIVNENGEVYVSTWYSTRSNIGVYHSSISDMRNWELVAFEGIAVKSMAFDPEGNVVCGVGSGSYFSGFEHESGFYAFWANSISIANNGIIYQPRLLNSNTAVLAYSLDHGEHFYNTVENLPLKEPVAGSEDGFLSIGRDNHLYFIGNRQYWRSIPNAEDIPSTFSLQSDWYYEILNLDGSITYQHLQCTGDTVVQGKRPKIIVRSNTHYDRDTISINEVTHEYILEENGKIYWWNKDLEEFTTLYDLAANVGDEWEIEVGNVSITMHVDAVENYLYEGKIYRKLTVSDSEELFSGDIVCGIGHLTSFFPEKLMNRGKGFRVEGLRCYWLGGDLLLKIGERDCDEVYEQLHHGLNETNGPHLAVYPNPASGVLFIETRLIASQPDPTYRITNLMGQTLMTGTLSVRLPQCDNPTTIDVSQLPAGMYFISVGEQTMKFVKQ